MSKQDPIADALTRIRNAQAVAKKTVTMPSSKPLVEILKVMTDEGYIESYDVAGDVKKEVTVSLKYFEGKPVIEELSRLSTPGRRRYCACKDLPVKKDGLGIVIVTTPQGVMTTASAKKLGIGGEVLAEVY